MSAARETTPPGRWNRPPFLLCWGSADQPLPWPKSIGMFSDGTLDARNVKDWIRENWVKDLERETNNG